ncbi:unnamed protein product [Bursaphelenchus okinawaensis]|uniref:Uncharacterized protein n=1 Tax=Bursaphelenchus okinawaensis TaxID=465554 RepID=A0A811LRU0_9BILA|nr:unnamed protein product [Bursaphelenchus okinawaensis]CAG9127280.1 unnamed protein product [Bursaphelenchus okinawaensis]
MIKFIVQLLFFYIVLATLATARPYHDGLTSGTILSNGGGNLDNNYLFAVPAGGSAAYSPYYATGFFG